MTDKLNRGYINSGYLFIGDPSSMSAGKVPGEDDKVDPYNPFYNYDKLLENINGQEMYNLKYEGYSDELYGRGIVVDTNRPSGAYVVELIKNEIGQLTEIRIRIN